MAITVVVADDHPIFRRGLRTLLDAEPGFSIIGEASDGQEAIDLIKRLKPDVVVLDLMMPKMNGLDVLRAISSQRHQPKCVVISPHCHDAIVGGALAAGAACYVFKEGAEQNLIDAVRAAATGRRYLGPLLNHKAIDDYIAQARSLREGQHGQLTRREREVMQFSALGMTSLQIAARLHISPRTVECHRANLMRKLHLSSLPDLVRYAFQHHLVLVEN